MAWLICKIKTNPSGGIELESSGKILPDELSDEVLAMFESVDMKVKITESDTLAAPLYSKLVAGDGITLIIQSPGGEETLKVNSDALVLVSDTDTTRDYISVKIVHGEYLKSQILNAAGNESFEIDLDLSKLPVLQLGWVDEVIAEASIRADEDLFDVETAFLNPSGGTLKNIIHIEDVGATAGPMGCIRSIGSTISMDAAQWAKCEGLQLEYVAAENNWFNIKNGGTPPTGGDHKTIYTGTGADVNFVSRALFAYDDYLSGKWVLKSYTPAKWGMVYPIAGTPGTDILITAQLPRPGIYSFYAYVKVSEKTGGSYVATENVQELKVKSSAQTLVVDTSGFFIPSELAPSIQWTNISLQGSGLITIDYDVENNLKIYVNVTLPNGEDKAIESGYLHLKYLGPLINY